LTPCRPVTAKRLRKEALHVKIRDIDIGDFSKMSVKDAAIYAEGLASKLTEREMTISRRVIKRLENVFRSCNGSASDISRWTGRH